MKKRFMVILLTLCMALTLLPTTVLAAGTTTPNQNNSETFANFSLRMQSEYDVKVTCADSVTITPEEQGWIEQGLSVWGKDFIKVVSAGFGKNRQFRIHITKNDGLSGDFQASGMMMGSTLYLYPGWTYITVIHEIVHATNFSLEAKALADIYKRNLDAEFCIKIAEVNKKFGSEPYGGKYGDPIITAYEDIAHILQNGYDSDWIAKIKRGSSPEIVAKIEVFRDFYVDYLTGGATPCLLVDSILGTNDVSISSQPAVTTTVIEGNIEGSLYVDAINSGGKKVSYRWATSERNIFPPHGSLTQVKTASMEIPKSLKAGTYYYFCVIYIDGKEALNSNIASVIVKPKQTDSQTDSQTVTDVDPSTLKVGLNILSVPTKTVYSVGDGFDIAGVRAVNKNRDGIIVEETENLKFFTSKTVELTQGRPFTTTGKKVIEIRHANSGVKWAEYTITVSKKAVETPSTPPVPAPASTPPNTVTATPTNIVTATPTNTVTAKPTNTKFMLNGAEVALPAYSIGGNNYVKLRDVGALLKTRFDVRWEDGKAKLYNHAAYTKASGELAAIGKDSKSATISTTDFVWGDTGAAVTGLTAYTIGGNNYIKLRDIAKLFDFDVDWRDGKAWIEPDVSPYTED